MFGGGGTTVYGVPADLSLAFLHEAVLIQVCIGQFQLQFHFHPSGNISVEGGWELLGADGACIDSEKRGHGTDRPPYQLHQLLGQKIVGSELSPPNWFALRFETGAVLRVYDDSTQYESFSIQPGNIFV
jgi:hypothetical protein